MKMLRPGASASRAIALVIAITLAACSSGANPIISRGFEPSPLVVVTNKGDVQGFTAGSNRKFLGIPYAAAPTGSLRFEPPQPRAAWTTTLKATQPGTICPQGGPPLAPFGVSQSTSEDCLNLNVTTPTGAAKLPVMVWIHGGAFDQGSGAFYPADQFAEGGIVVVTINYRLGVFGYLALPALDTSGKLQTGNYGIEDQIAALQWVHTNIAAFGGDPTKVTIAGESAGAQSVCMLAENAASGGPAKGLFIRGITESGPCQAPINTLTAAEQSGATTAGQLGCPTSGAAAVTCLQSSSLSIPNATALAASATSEAFAPSAGGLDIPQQPKSAIGTMPLLAGG